MEILDKKEEALIEFLSGHKKKLALTYRIEEVDEAEGKRIGSLLENSIILPAHDKPTFINAYKIENQKSGFTAWLANVVIDYRLRPSKFYSKDYSDLQMLGLLNIKKCPHIYIKPESMGDKIMDVFTNVDLDFPQYPEFSNKYHVVTDNKKDASAKLKNLSFCNALIKVKEAFVEIKDEHLMVRFRKNSAFKDPLIIASLLEELDKNKSLGLHGV